MKALIYNKKARHGELTLSEVDKPFPKNNEVLVKIAATSVNAADYRSMKMGLIPKHKTFGADISGRVEAVGKEVKKFKPGDEVIGDLADSGFGGFAEYAVATEKVLTQKPQNLSFQEAAAIPLAAGTALQALRDKGNVREGHHVLIIGSSGGVGTYAIQLAKYFKARVTAVCSARNADQAKALGADEVIDYTRKDITKSEITYDVILAINGNYSLLACKRILKSNGIYVAVGGALPQVFKTVLFGWALSFGSKKIQFLMAKPKAEDLEFIASLAEKNELKPIIEKTYPLEQGAEAMRYVMQGHAKGKVVISVV